LVIKSYFKPMQGTTIQKTEVFYVDQQQSAGQ